MSLDADLAATTSYVTHVRRAIARQLLQVVKLSDVGCSTMDAEATVEALRSTLSVLEKHERHLQELKQRAVPA